MTAAEKKYSIFTIHIRKKTLLLHASKRKCIGKVPILSGDKSMSVDEEIKFNKNEYLSKTGSAFSIYKKYVVGKKYFLNGKFHKCHTQNIIACGIQKERKRKNGVKWNYYLNIWIQNLRLMFEAPIYRSDIEISLNNLHWLRLMRFCSYRKRFILCSKWLLVFFSATNRFTIHRDIIISAFSWMYVFYAYNNLKRY